MIKKQINEDGTVEDYFDIAGTFRQGTLDATYADIVAAFGKPEKGDGYKVQAQWSIMTPDSVATIYDYKQGDCYNGIGNGIKAQDVTEWSIGGHNSAVCQWIKNAITKAIA